MAWMLLCGPQEGLANAGLRDLIAVDGLRKTQAEKEGIATMNSVFKRWAILTMVVGGLAIVLSGCTVTAKMSLVPVANDRPKLPVTYAMIADESVCGKDITTLEVNHPGGSKSLRNSDISASVLANAENVLKGVLANGITVRPTDSQAQADLFVMPRVLSSKVKTDGMAAWGDCTFSIDIAFVFLDANRIPLFEIVSSGQATSQVGRGNMEGVRTQRGYDAVAKAMRGFPEKIARSPELGFVVANLEFFKMEDADRRKALDRVLADDALKNSVGPMLMAYAVKAGSPQLMEGLLARGVSAGTVYGSEGYSLMHWAALYNDEDMIRRLARAGATPSARDKAGRSPLYYAAWNGTVEATEALLALNADIDVYDDKHPADSAYQEIAFGDYYSSQWKKESARMCYQLARTHMQQAGATFEKEAEKAKSQAAMRVVGAIVGAAVMGALEGASASIQARQTAQLVALRNASHAASKGAVVGGLRQTIPRGSGMALATALSNSGSSGRGGVTYYSALRQVQRVQVQQPLGMTTMTGPDPAGIADLDAKAKAYQELKKQSDVSLREIDKRLAMLESSSSYNDFRSGLK